MRYVIDSNQLQSEQLRVFLTKSASNIAVLPDFVAMEAYKGDPLKTIFKSMSILSEFPNQVLILKGSRKICNLTGRRKGLQRRLVDEDQTRNFPFYIRQLRAAEAGDMQLQSQILSFGSYANEHLDKMLDEAKNIRGAIEIIARNYTKEERAILRTKEKYTSELIDRLIGSVMEMTGVMFQDFACIRKMPTYEELPNTFMFRANFAMHLNSLRKFSQGGFSDISAEKLRNDFVDMMLVAYGTYFDGLMSSDKNVTYMFQETGLLLSALLDADVPSLAKLR